MKECHQRQMLINIRRLQPDSWHYFKNKIPQIEQICTGIYLCKSAVGGIRIKKIYQMEGTNSIVLVLAGTNIPITPFSPTLITILKKNDKNPINKRVPHIAARII